MANLPPPNHDANLPEDELVQPEPALIILYHIPAQPEGYVNDEADPEEEPIPEQALAALVGFAPQWIGGQILNNNNEWLEEDDEENPKEDDDEDPEEDEVDEDDEEDPKENDDEDPDEDEVGNGEEEKMEIDDEMDNPKVIDPDVPPPPVFYRTTKLEKQMFERYNTEIKIKKKFNEDGLRMNRHELDVTIKYSKMKSQWEAWVSPCIPERLRFQEEPPIPSGFAPRTDDPYVMARDAAMATQEDDDDDDDDDDDAAAKDPQPSESRGSPHDQYHEQNHAPERRSEPTSTYFDSRALTQEAADQLVREGIEAAIRAERERVREEANRAGGPAGGLAA
ncbi:hypothetical protein Tco_0839449 [Tanacetum coccineum]|uniref:Uncharacterized protein n=1 Tax=Tanacetum coccineum TaxID=301880 RepID=A0ABQ5ATG0_9ASTR